MFPKKIFAFHSFSIPPENSSLYQDFDYMIPNELAKPYDQIKNIYFQKGNN
jgi:hypothetical protein